MSFRKRYILSIDGGGMRGIIPSVVLSEFSSLLNEMGDNRPLYSHFDLIAGTSTGALIALAIAMPPVGIPKSPNDYAIERTVRKGFFRRKIKETVGILEGGSDIALFRKLYEKAGSDVFSDEYAWKKFIKIIYSVGLTSISPAIGVPALLYTLINIIAGGRYDSKILENFLKSVFGDASLSSSYVPVMAVTTSSSGKPISFTSVRTPDEKAWRAARASTAAPTYFSPVADGMKSMLDGGLSANNPSFLAYSEASEYYPDADEYVVLSLSTGSKSSFSVSDMITGISSQMENTERKAAATENLRYIRIPVNLEKSVKMDDASQETLEYLGSAGKEAFEKNRVILTELASELRNEPIHDSVRIIPYP